MKPGRAPAVLLLGLVLVSTSASPQDTEEALESRTTLQQILLTWAGEENGEPTAAGELLGYVKKHFRLRGPTPRTHEAKILRRLADDKPAVLIPIIALYNQAHLLAVRQQNGSGATYLQLEATRLIEEYMSAVHSPQGWRLGSRFYVSLAASLRETADIGLALQLLEEALDAEPSNVHALFASAAIREKFGQYSSAAALFRRILEQAPIPEARLRLALCQARSGKTKDADRLLHDLARGPGPDWIRAIAYQELSQLQMRRGDPDGALELAREGQQELPHDESLAILLAFMGGPRDPMARTLATRLTSDPSGTGATARGLYNLWPSGNANNEAVLEREVSVRMPLLQQALELAAGAETGVAARSP